MTMATARKIAETVLAGGLGDGNRAYTDADKTAAYRKLCTSTAADAASLTNRLEIHLEARGIDL